MVLASVLALSVFTAAQGRPTATPSDSGLIADILAIKDIGCDYVRTENSITVVEVKIYLDGHETKSSLPVVYPTFKTAMTACGEFYDQMISERRYAVAYRKNTVNARR